MHQVAIEVEGRNTQGKGAAHKLRAQGLVPGIIYSRGGDNTKIQMQERDLKRVLAAGQSVIVNLKIKDVAGPDATAMVSEVQRDIFQKHILHVDFHRIRMDESVHSAIRINFHGHAAGEKEGGMVDHLRNEIEVDGLPGLLPEHIDIDVSKLQIGDSIHMRDVQLPEGVTTRVDPDEMLVVVHSPKAQEESAVAADTELGAAVTPPATPA